VARFGGEEFVIVPNHDDHRSALAKAESLRNSIQRSKPCGLDLTASFGVTSLLSPDDEFLDLFSRADKAVFVAKACARVHSLFWPGSLGSVAK
jgi:two-component system, cell cycle response regulator